MEDKKVSIELPFSGFYESIHSSNIDMAIENEFNWDAEKDEVKEISPEVDDAIWSADVDWGAIQLEYAKNYTKAFGDEFDLDLEFEEIQSPREYNFSTDQIFCKVPIEQINKIRKEVESHKDWPEHIKKHFTSYDGFWSNYSSDYRDEQWTREVLDEAQYRTILEFWLSNINSENQFWEESEIWLFEMANWDSVVNAVEVINKYAKENGIKI